MEKRMSLFEKKGVPFKLQAEMGPEDPVGLKPFCRDWAEKNESR